jgi:hypothetical protein
MKDSKKIQIILFAKYSFRNLQQKELVRWLTTLQPLIEQQKQSVKKFVLKNLNDTPPIYMS